MEELIMNMVSNLGFPIVMCLLMAYYIRESNNRWLKKIEGLDSKYDQTIISLSEAVWNNTQAMNSMVEKLERSIEHVSADIQ